MASGIRQGAVITKGDPLTLSRLEGEHTHQRSSDQMEAVQWASPVLVFFIRVDYRDAEQQQHLYRCLIMAQDDLQNKNNFK